MAREALSCMACTAPLPIGNIRTGIKCEYCNTTNKESEEPDAFIARVIGNGASAQGKNAKAVGMNGVLVEGDVTGNITIGNNNTYGK